MGIEIFERAAEERGRVLRVEQLASADVRDPRRGPGFLITFDLGRILVAADPTNERLLVRNVPSPEEIASLRLDSLDEEEPWWRVVGNAITRAWPGADGGEGAVSDEALNGVRLQFREDDENPKVISLRYESGAVRVGEESAHGR